MHIFIQFQPRGHTSVEAGVNWGSPWFSGELHLVNGKVIAQGQIWSDFLSNHPLVPEFNSEWILGKPNNVFLENFIKAP